MCGYQISDTVNLKISKEQIDLVEDVKLLLDDELQEIVQNGGLIDTQGLREKLFERVREKKEISKERYIAEALFSMYDWKKIGIEEFSKEDRELVIQKIQEAGYKEELPEMTYSEFIEFLGLNKIEGTNLEDIWYQRQAINRTKELYEEGKKFSAVVLPTASGKTGVPAGLMQEFLDKLNQGDTKYGKGKILYLAPDNEILNQTKDFIIEHILPKEMTIGKKRDKVLKEAGIEFKTYSSLLNEKNRKGKYKFVVIDEAHRGGDEWNNALDELIENQDEDTYFMSLTATPNDREGRDIVQDLCLRHKDRFGYTEEEIENNEYMAKNLNLIDGIKLGILENFIVAEAITQTMKDAVEAKTDEERIAAIEEYEMQRRDLSKAEGMGEFISGQLKEGDKVIVFMPVNYEIDENGTEQELDENSPISMQKLKAFEKQEKEWLKELGVEQHYYSMLGCYGDRKNEKQLKGFEEQDSGISIMTVINKGTLGLHIEGVNKVIIARPLDKKSITLLLQMIGRAMRRADSKNPLPKEEWPVIIDLCGNMKILEELIREIKEVKRRDDLRILEDIVDWIQDNNGGMYPNAEGKTSQERKMAIQLYRIYDKYLKYIDEEEIEGKKEERKEYVRKILTVGEEIDLWEKELEPIKEEIKKKEEINPFEVEGTLREFLKIEDEINLKNGLTKFEEVMKFARENGRIPKHIHIAKEKMTEEEKREIRLYDKWRRTEEKGIVDIYKGKTLEEIPEKDRKLVEEIRSYGYGLGNGLTKFEEVMKFARENGRFPKSTDKNKEERSLFDKWKTTEEKGIVDTYKRKTLEEIPEKDRKLVEEIRGYGYGLTVMDFIRENGRIPRQKSREERKLYARWFRSEEKGIVDKYEGKPLKEIPEKDRKLVEEIRSYGYGLGNGLTKFEEVMKFARENGRFPKFTDKNKEERSLFEKWRTTEEKGIVDMYEGEPLEEIPEEYRKLVEEIRSYGYGLGNGLTKFEEVMKFARENGRLPKNIQGERSLYEKWRTTEEKGIVDMYEGEPLEEIPEEYRKLVEEIRSYGYGLTKFEEVMKFARENGRLPKSTDKNKEERSLFDKWKKTEEKGIVDTYEGKPLEEIPEEYRKLVEEIRSYGYGLTKFEEVMKFARENGRIPKKINKIASKMTEEEKRENRLYNKWKKTEEKRIVDTYKGKTPEEIPEEYRQLVGEIRSYGYGLGNGLTKFEEVMKFARENGRIPKHIHIAKEKMTEEEKRENRLYDKWTDTEEKGIVDMYEGEQLEEIPEEYRKLVEEIRSYGYYGLKRKQPARNVAIAVQDVTGYEYKEAENFIEFITPEKTKGGVSQSDQ